MMTPDQKAVAVAFTAMINKTTHQQQAALIFYYRIAMKGRTPERREVLWRWAERTCNRNMKPLVAELHGIATKLTESMKGAS